MSERAGSTSSFGGMKDFSVDAQRKMFMEAQEKARKEAAKHEAERKAAAEEALRLDKQRI